MQRVLQLGSRGDDVAAIAQRLVLGGFLAAVTDTFSDSVMDAVRAFQQSHRDPEGRPLVVDGIVGPLTAQALANLDPTSPAAPNNGLFRVDSHGGLPNGGSEAGRAALAAALGEMAAGACEVGVNNAGPWVEKYLNGIVAPPANWCAGFVSWCYLHAPGGIPFRYSLGARDIFHQFVSKNWAFQSANLIPQPGDIVVWWRDNPSGWQGHIGLVHNVANGCLTTVEANKGRFPASVSQFTYELSRMDRVLGFGRVR
ncbi:MAG: CHAP domain-containing protein [Rhodospirillales bacterium]|nr:CHAP domain-containing protein [Rhodospirillales bacterium]